MFIIDMSQSLKDAQLAVLKHRLIGTLGDLSRRDQFEMLFFSGPTWVIEQDPHLIKADWRRISNHHNYQPSRIAGKDLASLFAPHRRRIYD